MALSDPQTITIGATTSPLARITDDGYTGVYQSADGNVKMTVTSAKTSNGRLRATVRVDQRVVAADPLTAINQSLTGTTYFVFDFPVLGFTTATKIALYDGLKNQLAASTNAMLTKVLELQH